MTKNLTMLRSGLRPAPLLHLASPRTWFMIEQTGDKPRPYRHHDPGSYPPVCPLRGQPAPFRQGGHIQCPTLYRVHGPPGTVESGQGPACRGDYQPPVSLEQGRTSGRGKPLPYEASSINGGPCGPPLNSKTPPGFPGGAVRACRAGPIITCTKGQVGRLSSVSLLPTSDRSREACNPQIQIGIPYERCGFNGPSCRKGQTRTPQNFVPCLCRQYMPPA